MTWVARGFLGGRRELEIRTLPRAARRLSAPPSPQPSAASRNSPVLLLAIAVPAAALFASALVLLLLRFLRKRRLSASAPPLSTAGGARRRGDSALQRQLRQLFHLPDSGLDQSVIDALPVFLYKELVGPKEPFDCAVCLCEFAADDKLRLLPACSHAFHLGCIDTWLQSNSTCPLCRGGLFLPGPGLHSPVSGEAPEEEAAASVTLEDGPQLPTQKPEELDDQSPPNCDDDPEKMVFPVRLGKFRSMVTEPTTITGDTDTSIVTAEKSNEFCGISKEEGDSSSSNSSRRSDGNVNCSRIDGRRCYSMGSCQYVEGDSILQVVLSRNWDGRSGRRRGLNLNPGGEERLPGKRLVVGSRGESFSVSKIWQWTGRKGKVAMPMDGGASLEGGLPWIKRGGGAEGSNS